MIVIRVELWSAITGEKKELARMHISNIGGTATLGDYEGQTFIGRDTAALNKLRLSKSATLHRYPPPSPPRVEPGGPHAHHDGI